MDSIQWVVSAKSCENVFVITFKCLVWTYFGMQCGLQELLLQWIRDLGMILTVHIHRSQFCDSCIPLRKTICTFEYQDLPQSLDEERRRNCFVTILWLCHIKYLWMPVTFVIIGCDTSGQYTVHLVKEGRRQIMTDLLLSYFWRFHIKNCYTHFSKKYCLHEYISDCLLCVIVQDISATQSSQIDIEITTCV